MKFEIKQIKPIMSHEEKVYEYARRISYYSITASSQKSLSKVFACENTERNKALFDEECGCFKYGANEHHEPCKPCLNAHEHYIKYRDAVNKKAAALRQLNKEMRK